MEIDLLHLCLTKKLAKPGGFSYSGFIGKNEDIISVLKNDNRIVKQLRLKHNDLAKPLFHVWNAILGKYLGKHSINNCTIFYNDHKIIINAEGGKGYQESIFHDEIEGRWNISIKRDLNKKEISVLKRSYSGLSEKKLKTLISKLSEIRISEMNPFYIMRYGFYEGHTAYRADPITISLIFGLRSVDEIIGVFGKELPKTLYLHKK